MYEQWNLDVGSYLYHFMVMLLGAVICALLLLRAGENNIDMSFKQSYRTLHELYKLSTTDTILVWT